jgi:predicted secreted protein
MAAPTVLAGTKLLILAGDGATPETFSQPCGLTTRKFSLKASTNSTLVPDCDNPEAPAWETKDVNALSATVTGSGVLAVEAFHYWNNWFMSAEAKNAQIKLDHASLGHWSGAFILTQFDVTGQRGSKVTVDITLENAATVVWADAA